MLKAVSLFVFLFVPFVHAQSPLILANSHSWAPLSFSEGGDDPDGLLVEFWELYSTYTGQVVEFKLRNWGGNRAGAQWRGKCSCGFIEVSSKAAISCFFGSNLSLDDGVVC